MSKKDWKKQLLRVKELADQHLGRAEKTEALSEDLQLLEKRVDLIRQACQATSKKVSSCMQGHGVETEKRMKKIPESLLANALIQQASLLGEGSLMGGMMKMCGEAESHLAKDLLEHELQVETQVIQPLHTILEVDFPNLSRLKKHLTKVVLDYDTAKSRYQSSQRETQRGNLNPSKLDSMRDEMEDAHNQVDLSKDQFATEMYNLVSREPEFSNTLLELVKAQALFHKHALETLERLVPLMQEQLENHHQMPVYGQALEDHLRRTKRDIAQVIEDCICALIEIGMDEEGLFRVAGATSMVKKLTAAFDAGTVEMTEYARDVHCIAGALKQYLRELPEPLLTFTLYSEWVQATHLPPEQRLQSLGNILEKMPKPNYNNLRYLIKFLQKVSENAEVNKMSPSNIAIVIGPNLLWPPGDGGPTVMTTSAPTSIVDTLICNADWFFPGDLDFSVTGSDTSGTPPGTLTSPPKGAQDNLSTCTASSTASSLHVGHNSAVTDSNGPTSSPMAGRKSAKKLAPLPPGLMDRPQGPAPPPPQGSTVGEHRRAGSEGVTITTANDRADVTYSVEKPPIPGRPQLSSPLPVTSSAATGSRPDRPQGPPPDRPLGPPPEIPDRPTSPVSEHASAVPARPGGPPPASPGQPPPIAAKPDSPSSLSGASQQPQALPRSSKPPRPNPRPPPPPKHPFKLSESGCDADELPKAAERKEGRTS